MIGPMATFHIECDQPIRRLELLIGRESRHYGVKTHLPVLEVSVFQAPTTFITSIQLST